MARWHIVPQSEGFELVYENSRGQTASCGTTQGHPMETVLEWVLVYGATTALDTIVLPSGAVIPVQPVCKA